jgi:phenylacetic acid degradation operon negative regulatory protein
VLARVPESNRGGRHLLNTRMRWAAFGHPAPGMWISTHTDRMTEAEQVLREAGAHKQAHIFLSEYLAGELPRLVRQAWDLDELDQRYEQFIEEFSSPPSDDPIVRVTRLVHAWRMLALVDPALPEDLLPKGWSGIRATKLFHRQHAKWEPAAIRAWGQISRRAT